MPLLFPTIRQVLWQCTLTASSHLVLQMGGNYNYMVGMVILPRCHEVADMDDCKSYVLFDQVFWRATAGQINRWRRNTLGLPSTSLDKMEPHKIPFLYNFSTKVVPRPIDWPEWIHVTGETG